ncbi:hypothetical protein [Mesoplasma lactucae]|uniref:Uncharacterized protein n=1 Tax=Mesoplasma lactucae ATCC 49193 TaxID=81460 RepID=A0A291IRL0_9MOLU|nr:hypothetical protein [Mesoplasma lactucae]ATG97423.1 hypothetical protein CP520_01450 [Mesoplasma lactucae ATCC 49193]ATZ20124.1 hypothetical protein MLACT_v1c03030 [Mesoplasma lactucae ATCC 49193]MCL8216872.1 hypothetical protein [Mesoplasma lactucae ATCC 49193]
MKINKKYFWAIGGILFFGIFAIIAFEAVGFRYKGPNDEITIIKLNNLLDTFGDDKMKSTYGLAVAGLVFAWVGLLIPTFGLFYKNNKQISRIIFWSTTFLEVLALVLLIASVSMFDANYKTALHLSEQQIKNKTYRLVKCAVIGQSVLIIVGGILALSGIGAARVDLVAKTKEKKTKAK